MCSIPNSPPGDCGDPASACNFCLAGHHCCFSKHSESIIQSGRGLMAGTRKSVGRCWYWQGLSLTRERGAQHFIQQRTKRQRFHILQRSAQLQLQHPDLCVFLVVSFSVSQPQNFCIHIKIQLISSELCTQKQSYNNKYDITHKQ